MLDVKRLRVLKEVAAQGSFSGAAEALAYTQSAVSQQIAALERETGSRLVERGARGVRLTDAGRALVAHADGIFARLCAAEAELEAIAGLRGGRLRLASFSTAGAALVPQAVARFTAQHPGVELSLIEADPEDSLPQLKDGELDVVLTYRYAALPGSAYEQLHDGLDLLHLLDDPMYVALPQDHPMASKPRLKMSDLAGEAWIQGDPRGLCGAMHIAACERAGFEPQVGFQSDDYNVVQGLVAAGVAVSLIPELALTNCREDIVIRELGRDEPIRRVYAAVLSGAHRSPAADAMLEILAQVAADHVARRVNRSAPATLRATAAPARRRAAAARAG
jgi:DNA-binding transcriptional LysR family regulator